MTDEELFAVRTCVARCIIEHGGSNELVESTMAPVTSLRAALAQRDEEVRRLREALAPFAAFSDSAHVDDGFVFESMLLEFMSHYDATAADFKRAAAALAEAEPKP